MRCCRWLRQEPRRAAGLPRLSCRALGSSAHDQPHRKRVRDRATQDGADERIAVVDDRQADGVQAGDRRIKNLAAAQRHKSVAEDDRRCQIQRWYRRHPRAGKPRRLIAPSPKIPHGSTAAARFLLVTPRAQSLAALLTSVLGPELGPQTDSSLRLFDNNGL